MFSLKLLPQGFVNINETQTSLSILHKSQYYVKESIQEWNKYSTISGIQPLKPWSDMVC